MRKGTLGVAGVGFAAQVFQALAIREVLGQVEGSEAVLGAALAAWLLGGAAGVLLGRRAAARTSEPARLLGLSAIAAAALAILGLLAVRFARGWLPLAPGEVPGIGTGLLIAAGGGFVPAIGYGFAFPLGARLLDGKGAYAVEAAGALLGGALFTFVLAPLVPPAGIAALALGVSAAPFLGAARLAAGIAVAVGIAGVVAGPFLERTTRAAAWKVYLPGHTLLATGQSRYGPLDVIGLGKQASLYRHGHLDFTSPDPEGAALKAHLALCLHPAPKRVFVAGGGPGVVREMLLEPIDSLVYADPDPEALTLSGDWIDPADRAAFRDPRVRIVATDPRAAIRDARGAYDVIALFGYEPSTAAANRFYTHDFFREVERALARDGILVLSLRGTGEYRAPDLLRRNARILLGFFQTNLLGRMVPGEAGFIVAHGDSSDFSSDPSVLARRFRDRGIRTAGMVPEHFDLVFPPGEADRLALDLDLAIPFRVGAWFRVNYDREPVSFHETLLLRAAEQGSLLRHLKEPSVPWVIAGAVLLAVLALAVFGRPADASVAGTGFTGMGVAVAILLGYQSSRGDLYAEIGLLGGLFMAGIAAGSCGLGGSLRRWDALVLGTVVFVPLAGLGPWACLPGAFLAGIVTGATFPAALAAGGDASRLYALDLAGSAAGALLVGTVFLPATGVPGVMGILVAVKTIGVVTAWIRAPGLPRAPA